MKVQARNPINDSTKQVNDDNLAWKMELSDSSSVHKKA